jgi:hypothetical protein
MQLADWPPIAVHSLGLSFTNDVIILPACHGRPPIPEPLCNSASPEVQTAILAIVEFYEQRLVKLEARVNDQAGTAVGRRP